MTTCPGCGVTLPVAASAPDPPDDVTSAECWQLYGEVIAYGMAHPAELGRWLQTTTDAYRLQHLSSSTPLITTAFGLNSLYLVFERGFTGLQAREAHGYLANTVDSWPTFELSSPVTYSMTVFDVAMADSPAEHAELVVKWGASVWAQWAPVHDEIAEMTDRQLTGWHPKVKG